MGDKLTPDDALPTVQGILENGEETPLTNNFLPRWANPREREENYHHVIRRLFETSDFREVEVYGPEADIGRFDTDVLIDIHPPEDEKVGFDEFVAIEVKTDPNAFQKSDNLEQLDKQVRSKSVDRVYACTPDSNEKTRLDVDPRGTQITRMLEFGDFGRALRGVEGKMRIEGRPLSKTAAYRQLLSEDKENFIKVAKQRGDWETIKENIENTDNAALPNSNNHEQEDNWKYDSLRNVGVLRLDPGSGELKTQDGAKHIDRNKKPTRAVQEEITESDIVHALWDHYITKSTLEVAVEVKPPSVKRRIENDVLKIDQTSGKPRVGKETTIEAPRIDILVADESEKYTGIEVKGPGYNKERLFEGQLPTYISAIELDRVKVAVPTSEVEKTKQLLNNEYSDVGLISVSDPRSDPEIREISEATKIDRSDIDESEMNMVCPGCDTEYSKYLIGHNDGRCLTCSRKLL